MLSSRHGRFLPIPIASSKTPFSDFDLCFYTHKKSEKLALTVNSMRLHARARKTVALIRRAAANQHSSTPGLLGFMLAIASLALYPSKKIIPITWQLFGLGRGFLPSERLLFVSHALSCDPASSPGILEIETACYPIDIKNFSGKE